jgi:hypothetical protein
MALRVRQIGLRGVNAVDSPLHLHDEDLTHAQNAQSSFADGFPALVKRPGLASFASGLTDPVLGLSSVPLPDPDYEPDNGATALVTAYDDYSTAARSFDGTTWSTFTMPGAESVGWDILASAPGRLVFRTSDGTTAYLRQYNGTTTTTLASITGAWQPFRAAAFDKDTWTLYWVADQAVYREGTLISPDPLAPLNGLTVSAGVPYVVNSHSGTACEVYRYNGGTSWTSLGTIALPFYAAGDFNGVPYFGLGVGLARVVDGILTQHVTSDAYHRLAAFGARLYTLRVDDTLTGRLSSSLDGETFTNELSGVSEDGWFAGFKSKLYAAFKTTFLVEVYRRNPGGTWTMVYATATYTPKLGFY